MAHIKRNNPCPCLSGRKYKHCCDGSVDWAIEKNNTIYHLSPRGRNLRFIDAVLGILQVDKIRTGDNPLEKLKAAITPDAVRRIYEAVLAHWPPDLDVEHALRRPPNDLSALYVGDYDRKFLRRGLARNSLYATKILVFDPFVYPAQIADEYNPILNPDQHRQQVLRNVHFYLELLPWVSSGLVEIIRSPADFDHSLRTDLLEFQNRKVETLPALKRAIEEEVTSLQARHLLDLQRNVLLASPDSRLRELFRESNQSEVSTQDEEAVKEDKFLDYVKELRARDPDFLEPLGPANVGQLSMISSGAGYEEARIVAGLTNAYLTTDLKARWKEIELDRRPPMGHTMPWTPFSKALNDAPIKVLNEVELHHALKLREEGRLDSMRSFLHRVWREASSDRPFDDANASALAAELQHEIDKAKIEWEQIDSDLTKIVTGGIFGGLTAGIQATTIAHGAMLAGAAFVGLVGTVSYGYSRYKQFKMRHPAAFFLKIND